MRIEKTSFRNMVATLLGAAFLAGAASVMAQVAPVGFMDYEPANVVPVPLGGGWFLLTLGLVLGAIAVWKIRRGGFSASRATHWFMALGAVGFFMTGGQVINQSYAPVGTPLSNPLGGTVDVFPGYQEYLNTSGTALRITDLVIFGCVAPEPDSKADASGPKLEVIPDFPTCEPGDTVLGNGEICTTDVPACPTNDRVTFREGYYWVRADYRAAREDHGSVCAEFGLTATEYSVPVEWDADLLTALSNDFGYLSNGDDNDSATGMWCWDGDGGPSPTPAGYCETHNFGSNFVNYGYWGSDTDIRPVFTCTDET